MGCIILLLPCLFSFPKQVYSNSPTNLYTLEFLSAISLPSRQSSHFLFAPRLFYLYVGLDFWFGFLRYLVLELVPAFFLKDGMFYKIFSLKIRKWEKKMWCLPFSYLKEQLMSESKIKKGDLKTIWFMMMLPFSLIVQFISEHMQGEDCEVRLMSMAETCSNSSS